MQDAIRAIEKALDAGSAALRRRFGVLQEADVENKGDIDLVTVADRESEAAVVAVLRDAFPAYVVLAEEAGGDRSAFRGGRFIVDPLDGTTNFAHAMPIFAVSIALEVDGVIVAGGVENPIAGERFLAERGAGATLNGRRLSVSRTETLDRSLLVTGFPYDRRARIDEILAPLRAFLLRSQGVLRLGSAALDLCHVGAGRLDGFWEENLQPWDTSAGMLVVTEAGGRGSDFAGGPFDPFGKQTLATNGRLHEACIEVLREARAR
jgi:myo-inositol-1(or 4)-monophosphatase